MKHDINPSSRRKLKPSDARRFEHLEPDLFVDLARVVCSTGVLPQKELHECWQMANCVHKEFPNIPRVADLAAGHGLLAWILVLLARVGENPLLRTAVAVDIKRPKSANLLAAAMTERWPQLANSVHYVEGSIDAVFSDVGCDTLFVAAHACGSLSDRVLLASLRSRSSFAVMPCCHSLRKQVQTLSTLAAASGLPPDAIDSVVSSASEVGQARLIDQFRIDALTAFGYEIRESSIPPEITAFNRIIIGQHPHADRSAVLNQPTPHHNLGKRLHGEIRAYENIRSLNVASLIEAQTLSKRPSREWIRSFDLSYWVDNEATGQQLGIALDVLVARILVPQWTEHATDTGAQAHLDSKAAFEFLSSGAIELPQLDNGVFTRTISILEQYSHPVTQRQAFTYRIEIKSATTEITKDHALLLRRRLCRTLKYLAPMLRAKIEMRGGLP